MIILLGLLLFFLYITALIGTNSENVRKFISKWFKSLLNEKEGFNTRLIAFSTFFVLLIGMPILVLILNTHYHFFTFNLEVSEKVGNIMNGATAPVITTLATILTFAAFWVQYQANQMQKEQFFKQFNQQKKESEEQKGQFEKQFNQQKKESEKQKVQFEKQMRLQERQFNKQLHEQDKINQKERFESHFFELLRVYGEQVKEMELDKNTKGKKVFENMYNTLKEAYKRSREYTSSAELLQMYYDCMYMQDFNAIIQLDPDKFILTLDKKEITAIDALFSEFENITLPNVPYQLGQYFRLLFHIVETIINHKILTDDEKYQYMKTLRTQLTIYEQFFLLLNSNTEWGKAWRKNESFTKWRITKNIPEPFFKEDFEINLEDLYKQLNAPNGKSSFGNKEIFIFEFEEKNANRTNS